MKKERKNIVKLIIFFVFLMFAGFISGYMSAKYGFQKIIFNLSDIIINFMKNNSISIFIFCTVGGLILTFTTYYFGKKQIINSINNEEEITKDTLMSISIIISSSLNILSLPAFTNFIVNNKILNKVYLIIMILTFILSFLLYAVLTAKQLNVLKLLNPEIYTDTTSFNFSKKYVESLDEREQLEVYKASYKGYKALTNTLMAFTILFTILGLYSEKLIIVSIIFGLSLVIGIIASSLESMKTKKY